MVFNTKAKVIFIDTDSPAIDSEEMFDVIVSPAYYWVKRMSLPVKYLREAKKLLPSLFEETLPKGKYSYMVYRDKDAYMMFAYNDKFILDALGEKGIKSVQVRRLYFAQSEFRGQEHSIALGDDILTQKEGVVIKLPAAFANDTVSINLHGHKCSSHSVVLERYSHIADTRSLVWFASFMAVLIALFALEWGIVNAKTAQIEQENSGVFEQYRLKSTMIQNEAVLQRLEKRYREQMKIRQINKAIFGLKLVKKERLIRFDILASRVVVEFSTGSSARAKALMAELKKTGLSFTDKLDNAVLRLEMVL